MEKEKKSFFDLSEKEQEKVKKEMKEKTKYWVKRILIGFFCVVLILFMVFSLIYGIFDKPEEEAIALFI